MSNEDKFEKHDINLFEVLNALDKKDYSYYDNLTVDQQNKLSMYVLTLWLSYVNDHSNIEEYYVRSINEVANKHLFNENLKNHPKLIWYTLCASSPGLKKRIKHQYIHHIKQSVVNLKSELSLKEAKEYFTKVYSNVDESLVNEYAKEYTKHHKIKMYLGKRYSSMKLEDIEVLSNIITEKDINEYEKDSGN